MEKRSFEQFVAKLAPHVLPDGGSVLLWWIRFSLRRSLRRSRSIARLYEALATGESDEASREWYRLLASHQHRREARKAARLFSLGACLPVNDDPLTTLVWRWLLVLCGPKVAVTWIEWRDAQDLTWIIAVARVAARIAANKISI